MIKPKPCPFCGGKIAVVICDDEGNLHDDDYLFNPYSHEWLSKSWQYEHQIFDLVRLYKSIDWDKDTLIFLGR